MAALTSRTPSGVYDHLFAGFYTDDALREAARMPGQWEWEGGYRQATEFTAMCSPVPSSSNGTGTGTGSGESSQESVYYDALEWVEPGRVGLGGEGSQGDRQARSGVWEGREAASSSSLGSGSFSDARSHPTAPDAETSPLPVFASLPSFMLPDSALSRLPSHSSSLPSHPSLPHPPSAPALFPQEIFTLILLLLPPRTAFSARLVSKSWYRDFWYVLVLQHWLSPLSPAFELRIRTPQSWIFEEFSTGTHGGCRMVLREREVVPMEDGVEIQCVFSLAPASPEPDAAAAELAHLRRILLRPIQLLCVHLPSSRRYWDFRIDLHLNWADTTLRLDGKQLVRAVLGRGEGEWPGVREIPVWVWRAPGGRGGTRGGWERYRHWSPTL